MFLTQLTGNEHLFLLGLLAEVLFACLPCLGLFVCGVWLFFFGGGAGGKGGRGWKWEGFLKLKMFYPTCPPALDSDCLGLL